MAHRHQLFENQISQTPLACSNLDNIYRLVRIRTLVLVPVIHKLNYQVCVALHNYKAKHKAKYACNITTVRNKRRSLRIRIEHRIRSFVVISQICPYFRFHQGDLILNHGNLRVHWRSILNRRFGLSRFLKN